MSNNTNKKIVNTLFKKTQESETITPETIAPEITPSEEIIVNVKPTLNEIILITKGVVATNRTIDSLTKDELRTYQRTGRMPN